MELFSSKKKADYTVIIGCGRLGASIANSISDEGRDVLIMDKDRGAFRKLAPSFGGLTITGDGTDLEVLQEAKITRAGVVIAVTDNDNTNIMIAQLAREVFKVELVIARLYDPEREFIYHEFGIDTICPSLLSVREIEKVLSKTHDHAQAVKLITA